MCVCFEFLSVGAWGDCSPYSRDRWAVLPGLSSPLAAHESWLILIKASLTFVSWGCCRWDIVAVMQQLQDQPQRAHFRPVFFFFFFLLKFHSHNSSSILSVPDLILSKTGFIPDPSGKMSSLCRGYCIIRLVFFLLLELPPSVSTHKHMKRQIQENQ